MISLAQLWLPIVLSAVLVFVASSLVHMVFKWHNSDYLKLANEDEVRAAVGKSKPGPGQYVIPYCADMKEMRSPEMQKKFVDGPVAFMTVRASGLPNMGKHLGQWFALSLVIGILTAYLASKSLQVGDSFLRVARVTSIVPFLAYAGGSVSAGIWYGKPWRSVAKEVLDGFIYGAVTALAFGMLWPH
jgi:hypothetical protein